MRAPSVMPRGSARPGWHFSRPRARSRSGRLRFRRSLPRGSTRSATSQADRNARSFSSLNSEARWTPDALYEVLHPAQDAAEVRRFGLHGLRHLYSSILAESGASVKFRQERLGHADAGTTMNVYTHLLTDQGREYAQKVEEAFQFSSVSLKLAKPENAGCQLEMLN